VEGVGGGPGGELSCLGGIERRVTGSGGWVCGLKGKDGKYKTIGLLGKFIFLFLCLFVCFSSF
jgi:hypothetical protein